jgi:hypothetical protein
VLCFTSLAALMFTKSCSKFIVDFCFEFVTFQVFDFFSPPIIYLSFCFSFIFLMYFSFSSQMASQDSIPNFVFETRAEPSNIRGCTPAKTNRNRGDDEVDIGRRSGKKNDDTSEVVIGMLENDNHVIPPRLLPLPLSSSTHTQAAAVVVNNPCKDSSDTVEQKGDDTDYTGPSSHFASR